MATVTGITAERAEEIEDASVVSGAINTGNGHLILTKGDGATIDAGVARPDAAIAAAVLVETNNRVADVNAEEAARIAADSAEVTARNSAISTAVSAHVTALHTDSGWITLTLSSPWTGTVSYRKVNNRIFMKGSATRPSGSNATIGNLPSTFRPIGASLNLIAREGASTQTLAIATNGDVVVGSGYTNNNPLHLDAVSFFND